MKNKGIAGLFYKDKRCKKEAANNLTAMLLPSILSILLCAICLTGSTLAWFTASQSTATQVIQAASYDISAIVMLDEAELSEENDIYSLEIGEYIVNLTAIGDANTGYCILDFGGTKVFTDQIARGVTHSFTLYICEATTLKIMAQWGTYAGEDKLINSSMYTYSGNVQEADSMSDKENSENAEETEAIEETVPPVSESEVPESTENEETATPVPEGEVAENVENSTAPVETT